MELPKYLGPGYNIFEKQKNTLTLNKCWENMAFPNYMGSRSQKPNYIVILRVFSISFKIFKNKILWSAEP